MVEISRSLAKQLSTVLRRSFRRPYGSVSPMVEIRTDAQGLCVRSIHEEVAVEYREPGSFGPDSVLVPIDALSTVQGRDANPVVFDPGSNGQVVARWLDAGMPQVMAFVVPDAKMRLPFPDVPEKFASNPATLLTALAEASRTAATDSTCYALQRIQLRGTKGKVVGTDSKQLFVQGGFNLGFEADVLVPRGLMFDCDQLGSVDAVEIGKTKSHVAVRVGKWTFFLTIDDNGRYPDYEAIIPSTIAAKTACRFGSEDVSFLLRSIPRLPGKDAFNKPVTLDLNGQVCLRAKGDEQPQVTELVLSHTISSGQATRINMFRDHFTRALQLGFIEIEIVSEDRPLICRDGQRTYLTMPLDKKDALATGENPLRIVSGAAQQPMKIHQPKREKTAMSAPSTNGHDQATEGRQTSATAPATNRIGLAALIMDTQSLKESARITFNQASRLLVALVRHRKQSKLMVSTLKSLKELQTIDA